MLPWRRFWTETLERLPREEPRGEAWLSPTGTRAPLCLKRTPRRTWRGSHAPTVCPLPPCAALVACASCWLGSTSPWWERSPSAHSCLPPTPPSSSDPSCCWWPFAFSGPVACAADSPPRTARTGQRPAAAGAPAWWAAVGWRAGPRSKSRPASTPFRTPRPCSWAPRPRPAPRRSPARRRRPRAKPRRGRRPADSLPWWTPTALRPPPPAPSTRPRRLREGRWGSTCHVKRRSPSSRGTRSKPERCKYPSGPRACRLWPVSPSPPLCHISSRNKSSTRCFLTVMSTQHANPMKYWWVAGFGIEIPASRAVFPQVSAPDVGRYEEFPCHFRCCSGNLSCQRSSRRACVKRAGLEPFSKKAKVFDVKGHVCICNDIWHFVFCFQCWLGLWGINCNWSEDSQKAFCCIRFKPDKW